MRLLLIKRLNPDLEVTGIIIGTMYDDRKRLNRQVIDKIRNCFGDKLFYPLSRILAKQDAATDDDEKVM